jgi:hypothetical protein
MKKVKVIPNTNKDIYLVEPILDVDDDGETIVVDYFLYPVLAWSVSHDDEDEDDYPYLFPVTTEAYEAGRDLMLAVTLEKIAWWIPCDASGVGEESMLEALKELVKREEIRQKARQDRKIERAR